MSSTSITIVRPEALHETGEGVFYSDNPLMLVDQKVIEFLKHQARVVSRRRARLCAHPSPEAEQHDMLIVSHRDTYVAPHRHMNKTESFLILEGMADALFFDEQGVLAETVPMGPAGSGRPFFYRMPKARFHSLFIESELLVFVESTKGPFVPEETENAPWAPGVDEAEAGKAYMGALLNPGP